MPQPNCITALIYTDSAVADSLLRSIALRLMDEGLALAGLVQLNHPRPGRSRCDMVLEELGSGAIVPISQDRGPHARGCALDIGQLLSASAFVRNSMAANPDLVILNKFGKTESEGGGFRPLIAEVVERAIPLLLAVPWRNIESWRIFAGGLATEVPIVEGDKNLEAICSLFTRIACRNSPDQVTGAPGNGTAR
jgi:Protein of unknown function (DUF2478)